MPIEEEEDEEEEEEEEEEEYWSFTELRACPTHFSFHRLPKDNISWGRFGKVRSGETERIIEYSPIIMTRT